MSGCVKCVSLQTVGQWQLMQFDGPTCGELWHAEHAVVDVLNTFPGWHRVHGFGQACEGPNGTAESGWTMGSVEEKVVGVWQFWHWVWFPWWTP